MIAKNLYHAASSWWNQHTGQGGAGDHGGTGDVPFRMDRSPAEISELLAHAPLLRLVCESFGEDIVRAWRVHTSQPKKWLLLEEQYEIRDVVEKSLFYGEGYGGAFVIPRFSETNVDAGAMARPRKNLKRGLLGFGVYAQHELRVAPQTENMMQPNGLPMYYVLAAAPTVKIHHSWVFALRGALKLPTAQSHHQTHSIVLGQSRVDIIFDDYARMAAGYAALSHVLVKGNIDILKIKGLAEALSNCNSQTEVQGTLEKLVLQASATVTGANSFQPIVVDSEEDLERKGGNHAGAADIVRELQTMFVAASRRPRSKLFGEQAKGLGNGGEADERSYYDQCASFRERRCTSLLNWVDGIMAPGVETKWDYAPLWQMSEQALADLRGSIADTDVKYHGIGVPAIVEATYKRLRSTEQYTLPATMPAIKEVEPNAPSDPS